MTYHPDAETIARYQAGALARWRLLRRRRVAAHLARCPDCAAAARRTTAVTAVLAAAARPAMPADVAERLTEVLTTQTHPAPALTTHGRSRRLLTAPGGRRPQLMPVGIAVLILGVLGIGGYFIGQNSGSSAGPSASSGVSVSGPHSATGGPGSGIKLNPEHVGPEDSTPSGQVTYRVVSSGTDYQQATLGGQVTHEMADAALGAVAAPSGLAGCVARFAVDSAVRFVDIARYRGRKAWVIASSGRAWVTGTSCSAIGSDLLVTVPLAAS
jgi:hypothetical protein